MSVNVVSSTSSSVRPVSDNIFPVNAAKTAFIVGFAIIASTGVHTTSFPANSAKSGSGGYFFVDNSFNNASGQENVWMGGAMMPPEKLNNLNCIDEIANLKDNWNGNGANAFSADFLDKMRGIVTHLQRQPEIFPTAQDSIQFEYENSVGDYLEIEFFETGRIKLFSHTHKGESSSYDIQSKDIDRVVTEFYERKV